MYYVYMDYCVLYVYRGEYVLGIYGLLVKYSVYRGSYVMYICIIMYYLFMDYCVLCM
jgi:hypothetical protein